MKGTGRIRDFIIRRLRIKHTEAVMVLCREQQIFKAAFLCELRPFIRTELYRIKGLIGIPVLFLEGFLIRPVHIGAGPGGVAVRKGPGFQRAQLTAGRPVHHKAQLKSHKPVHMLTYLFFLRRHILICCRIRMHSVFYQFFFHSSAFPPAVTGSPRLSGSVFFCVISRIIRTVSVPSFSLWYTSPLPPLYQRPILSLTLRIPNPPET